MDEGCQLTPPERQLFQGDVFLSGKKHPGFTLLWEDFYFSVLCSVGITDDSHFVSSLSAVVSIQHMVQRDINKYQPDESLDMVLSWLLGIADR